MLTKVESGQDGNVGIQSAELGDTTGSSASSAVQLGASLVLLFLAFA